MSSRLLNLAFPKKLHEQPLKRSMSGFETEMFVLDSKGHVDHSDSVYKAAVKKKLNVQKECAKGMIEVICLPHKGVQFSMLNLWENTWQLMDVAKKHDKSLFPFATYPGVNKPKFRKDGWYKTKAKVLGEKRWINAGLCTGYHQHYTLPRGIFDHKKKEIKYSVNSKVKRSFLDSYNILNAVDPIFTCFLQSSPYVQGRFLAKDSRLLLYRGGKKLDYMDGLYAQRQLFGGLSPYKQTVEDLLSSLTLKHERWEQLVNAAGGKHVHDTILSSAWNPVKVNPHGTLEYRGGDMNLPGPVVAVSTMMKFLLREIQEEFLLVIPLDLELKDAFKQEGNLLFIPPQSMVRKKLQHASAYQGLANKDLYIYIKRFMKFIKPLVYKDYRQFLKPVIKMIENKQTISDKIVKKVKSMGGEEKIINATASEVSLYYSDIFEKEVERMVARLQDLIF